VTTPSDMWQILREPFPPGQIGALPRVTCPDCRDAASRVCNRHTKIQCGVCRQWITGAHMHLSYVGHAAVTDRLLKADPAWKWEPAYRVVDPQVLAAAVASGNGDIVDMVIQNSPPMLDHQGGMWIKMTVGGVTRFGYGATDNPRDPDLAKKLVSDAIRNAAMRFGVALDLWSKGDLGSGDEPASAAAPAASEPVAQTGRDWIAEANACTSLEALVALGYECNNVGAFADGVRVAMLRRRRELTPDPAAFNGFAGSAQH
jgi:hypothetical protein